jgi:hypothetical protein
MIQKDIVLHVLGARMTSDAVFAPLLVRFLISRSGEQSSSYGGEKGSGSEAETRCSRRIVWRIYLFQNESTRECCMNIHQRRMLRHHQR